MQCYFKSRDLNSTGIHTKLGPKFMKTKKEKISSNAGFLNNTKWFSNKNHLVLFTLI